MNSYQSQELSLCQPVTFRVLYMMKFNLAVMIVAVRTLPKLISSSSFSTETVEKVRKPSRKCSSFLNELPISDVTSSHSYSFFFARDEFLGKIRRKTIRLKAESLRIKAVRLKNNCTRFLASCAHTLKETACQSKFNSTSTTNSKRIILSKILPTD